jgi:hypothetical protein
LTVFTSKRRKFAKKNKAARGDFMSMQVIAGEGNMAVTSTEKDKPLIHNELAVFFLCVAFP